MQDKRITLDLSVQEINLVIGALATQPFNQVVDLISSVRNQAERQLSAPAPTPAPAPDVMPMPVEGAPA